MIPAILFFLVIFLLYIFVEAIFLYINGRFFFKEKSITLKKSTIITSLVFAITFLIGCIFGLIEWIVKALFDISLLNEIPVSLFLFSLAVTIYLYSYFLQKKAKIPEKKGIWVGICTHIFATLFFYLLLVLGHSHILSAIQNTGESMLPTYQNGDILMVQHISDTPKRYDTVVIKTEDQKLSIKRVIGLPGDVIEIKNGHTFINNEKIDESFFLETGETLKYLNHRAIVLKEKEYFVLGDNLNTSIDSRMIDPIKQEDITGIIFFPLYKK